jgi:hypothetical protein
MRLRPLALILLLPLLCGCTADRLRDRTVNQGSTLPDLQYQQVLDNLARFAADPAALPWHVELREGTSQITDSLSGGAAVELGPPSDWLPQLFGTRTIVAQWGATPVIEPLELKLLRVAYRRALGFPDMPEPELLHELAHELKGQVPLNPDLQDETAFFFENAAVPRSNDLPPALDDQLVTTNDDHFAFAQGPASPLARDVRRRIDALVREIAAIGPGWYHSGAKRDVPRNACHVGRYKDRYVWVTPEGSESLARFTFATLRIASLLKETQTLVNPGNVKFSPGDRG